MRVPILGVFIAWAAVGLLILSYACEADARSQYPPNIPVCTTAELQGSTCQGVQNKVGETIIITDSSFASNNPCSLIPEQAPGGGNAGNVEVWCERGEEDWFQTVTSTRSGSVPPPSHLIESSVAGSQQRREFSAIGETNTTSVRYVAFLTTVTNPADVSTIQLVTMEGIASERDAPASGGTAVLSAPINQTFLQDGGWLNVCTRIGIQVPDPASYLIEMTDFNDTNILDSCTIIDTLGVQEGLKCCMRSEYLDEPAFIAQFDAFNVRITPSNSPPATTIQVDASWLRLEKIVLIGASTVAGTVAFEPGVASKFDPENAWAFELARTHYNKFKIINHAFPGANSQDWDLGDPTEECRFTQAAIDDIAGKDGPFGPTIQFSEPAAFVFIQLVINDTVTFRTCSGGSPIAGEFTTNQLTATEFKTVTESIIAEVRTLTPHGRIILMTDYSSAESCPRLDGTEDCQYGVGAPQALFDFNAVYHDIADCPLDCRGDTCGGPNDPTSDIKCRDGVTASEDPSDLMEIPSVFFPNYSEPLDIGVTSPDRIHVGINGHEVLHQIAARAIELASFLEPLFDDD